MILSSDEVTSENHWQIASRVTQKSLFTVTNVSLYFLHAILFPEHTIPLKTNHRSLISQLSQEWYFWLSIVTSPQLICDVTRTWGTGIVASYLSIVLERANWRKGDFHQWITPVTIDFSPPGIHDFACKKTIYCTLFSNQKFRGSISHRIEDQ